METKPRRLIDGNITERLPVGYCHYHNGCLTIKQLILHKCLKRGCKRLQKYPNEFWDIRAKRKHKETIKS